MTPSARSTGFESCAGPIRTERAAAAAVFLPRSVTTAVKPVPCSSTGARTPATAMAGSTLASESPPPEWLQSQPPSATAASSAARATVARRVRRRCADRSAAGVTSERVYLRRKIRLIHTWEHSRAASRPFPTSRGGRQPQPPLVACADRVRISLPLESRVNECTCAARFDSSTQGSAHRRHFRREISLQRRALLRRLCLEKRPGRLHRLVEIAAGAGTRRTLPPSALHDELDALRLANDGRRTRAHRGVLRVRLEQELGAGADARQGLAQLVCQLGQQQRGVLLVRLTHAVSSGTEVEPPCLIADEDRKTLDLAAYGAGHQTRRAQAHAQLETPAPEREVEQRARAHARAQADDPLRTARPARRGGPGEGGNRACFDGGAPPAREGQPPAQQKGDRQREEVPRDVLGSAGQVGRDPIAVGKRVQSDNRGGLDGTKLAANADAGAKPRCAHRAPV